MGNPKIHSLRFEVAKSLEFYCRLLKISSVNFNFYFSFLPKMKFSYVFCFKLEVQGREKNGSERKKENNSER
jgi:hypothetical protein